MQERDTPAKDDFVMSGKQEDREESYDYSTAEGGGAKRSMKPIVIAGVVLLSAIIVVLMFLSGSPRSAEKDQLKNMDARLKTAEEKLAKLEWIDTGLARLDRKEKEMATMSERLLQLETAMNKKVDQLVREAAQAGGCGQGPGAGARFKNRCRGAQARARQDAGPGSGRENRRQDPDPRGAERRHPFRHQSQVRRAG